MRKLIQLAVVGVLVFGALACGADANTPDEVALRFSEHITGGEFADASELGTESTQQMLSLLVMMTSELSEEEVQAEFGTPDEITVVSSRIDGDEAIVVLSSAGTEETLHLTKVNGDWKVDLNKEEMDKGL